MPENYKRNVYLSMKTLAEAREVFENRFPGSLSGNHEMIPTVQALDRVLAQPAFARFSSPFFHASAMDGIAVKADDTYGASPDEPKELVLGQEAFYVNTGHILPDNTDAVIMIEQVRELSGDRVVVEASAYPWQHVRKVGEDIVATEMILPQGQELGPYELGALVAGGVFKVVVRKKPRVAIIPTGSELIGPETLEVMNPEPGRVIEFNSVILGALVERNGGQPLVLSIVPDDYDRIKQALAEAAEGDYDLIVINAGSSAGSEDYTATAIAELGEVLVHGVTIMPGKPTILGEINGKPVIGNPGYPVSSVISFEQFASPLLARYRGVPEPTRNTVKVVPTQALPSKLGLEEFIRVKLGRVRENIVAAPLPRGAGSITTLTRAQGIIRCSADSEGVGTGDRPRAELLRTMAEVEGTIVVIGSHDNSLDILGDLVRRQDAGITLSSGNVGSLGGLLTLKRGHSHLAGSHLLDTDTGDYNYSYIIRYLTGLPIRLFNLVTRVQGFIVQQGNPKDIHEFKDLLRDDVTFINRQAGSGTRILLDYNLKQAGLDPDSIRGYENDEFTHMAVAAAVQSGRADAGLAVFSSAKALNLDFIPVTTERYDLVIPEEFLNDNKIQTLLEVIRSSDFKNAVTGLGGYGVEQTGELLWIWDGQKGVEP